MEILKVLIIYSLITLPRSRRNHDTGQDIYWCCSFPPIACFPPSQFLYFYSMSSDAPDTCVLAHKLEGLDVRCLVIIRYYDQAFQVVLGRGKCPKHPERMNALIQAECEGDDQPLRRRRQSRHLPKKSAGIINDNNFFSSLPVDPSDADDGDFAGDDSDSSSESESLGSNSDVQEITNVELAAMLPTKTKTKRKANRPLPATSDSQASKRARMEEVDDEDSGSLQPSMSSALPRLLKLF
ncbi:hypothetical protein DEU56DRAFT_757674 [Suillus clintonianus]|uniref:uncharacterized protein n=1 Tax=Suillus clintonianus TaxID=1904413 RepID=UPI001B875771|nr:uncharacterized protein DEU56DRAFT_757674 [Suillus clintonianus]KAG2131047.1 hypothetical protein DEU56DRAFT_757674 [Suillus clintonianus]